MSTDAQNTKTWGDVLDEVTAIRLRLEKFSKLALAQELAVSIYVQREDVGRYVERLKKQETGAKAIRAVARSKRILDAIDRGEPIPFARRKRRRRARRQRPSTND